MKAERRIFKSLLLPDQLRHATITRIPVPGIGVAMLDAEVNRDDHCAVDLWWEFEISAGNADAFEVMCLWTGDFFDIDSAAGWEHLKTVYCDNGMVHHLYTRLAR